MPAPPRCESQAALTQHPPASLICQHLILQRKPRVLPQQLVLQCEPRVLGGQAAERILFDLLRLNTTLYFSALQGTLHGRLCFAVHPVLLTAVLGRRCTCGGAGAHQRNLVIARSWCSRALGACLGVTKTCQIEFHVHVGIRLRCAILLTEVEQARVRRHATARALQSGAGRRVHKFKKRVLDDQHAVGVGQCVWLVDARAGRSHDAT
mmetsp:Transcript_90300/g.210124  ORF Transcript_90300/g.210124 Transcript_90300/m.210124 type:complete len:208 (+) Transcript_90300:652-1275(+)